MHNIDLHKYKSVLLGLTVVIIIWAGLAFNLFHGIDRWLYDQQIMLPSIKLAESPTVMLLETDPAFHYAAAQDWFNILEKINTLSPKAIVLISKPQIWTDADITRAMALYPLFIGHNWQSSDLTNDEVSLLPPLDGKAYRQHWLTNTTNGKPVPSLAVTITSEVSDYTNTSELDRYFIDFRQAEGRIPTVKMQRLQQGGLVEALVKDRVVLIDFVDELSAKLITPVGEMRLPVYQAFALETLLSQNQIQHLNMPSVMLLSLFLVAALLVLVPRIKDKYLHLSFAAILMTSFAISWLLLMLSGIWIQTGVLLSAEIIVYSFIFYEYSNQQKLHLRKITHKSVSNVEKRWLTQSFFSTKEHWSQIANMVTQTLSLNRTIFLERVENDHRVKEIKALNCSLNDISEMRRDYQRVPYTTAIEKAGALRLTGKYLKKLDEQEIEYLVPLNFAGEIQGFWAFTVSDTPNYDEKKTLYAVTQLSLQIAEILYHRTQWLKHKEYEQRPLSRLLGMQYHESDFASINQAINFMTQRLTVMETVMDGMETAIILYDLFGRVVQVNETMSSALSEINIAPYSLTTADLISQLASCSLPEARNHLSYIILEKGTINLPIKDDIFGKGYMLSVRSLLQKDEQAFTEGDVHPFQIIGVLCELIDLSNVSEVYAHKDKVIEHLSIRMKADINTISANCEQINSNDETTEPEGEALALVKDKFASLAKNIDYINEFSKKDLNEHFSTHYPVDCREPLLQAIASTRKNKIVETNISSQLPDYIPLVIASAKELKTAFSVILEILDNDVVENGRIFIEVEEIENTVEFRLFNNGFGIPDNQLQASLDDDILASTEYKKLRASKRQIEDWGGSFVAYSAIGEGMRYSFTLLSFLPTVIGASANNQAQKV